MEPYELDKVDKMTGALKKQEEALAGLTVSLAKLAAILLRGFFFETIKGFVFGLIVGFLIGKFWV